MSRIPSFRHLAAGLALALLLGASAAAAELPAAALAKIDPALWEKVSRGEAGDLLVQFADPAIDAEIAAHLAGRGLRHEDDDALGLRSLRYRQLKARARAALGAAAPRKDYRQLPLSLMRLADAGALARLLARPEVAAVYEDRRLRKALAQSLPLVGQPTVAQAMGRTGTGYTVAVLDTGVDYGRAEFGSCTAPGTPAGCRVVAAFDSAPDDGLRDADGHGSGVAGTVAGIAPGANIAAIDVFDGDGAWSSDILEGIDWAIANRSAHHIVALNLSLGDGENHTAQCTAGDPFRQAIVNARNAGILTVAASGNEGYSNGLASPACVPEAVSVGAVYDGNLGQLNWGSCTDSSTAADRVACFSNSASFLSLLAPGALITVTGTTLGGTSFAAPHVAGALAVLAQAFPGDGTSQRLARLTDTGKAVTDSRNGLAKPRLDLLAAQGAPINDSFGISLMAGASGQATGWNLNASKQVGEPDHAGVGGGRSIWWNWVAPADGSLSLDSHGSGFDTLLALYTGNGVAALTMIAGNDDDGSAGHASGLSVPVLAGTYYRVAVDGKAGAAGTVTLHWSLRRAQDIAFAAIPEQPVNSRLDLAASASSGLAVGYSSQTPAVCTVAGSQADLIAAGTCSIAADQAGNADYLPAATVVQSFAVARLAQAISFPGLADHTLGDPGFAVAAGASSGLPVQFSTLTAAVCSVAGDQVALLAPGTCTLQADQAGDAVYAAAAPAQQSFAVLPAATDADVPLPAWALALLGAGLAGGLVRRRPAVNRAG